MSAWRDRVRDLALFEALTGGAFDRLNWQHSGEFEQNFSKKVKCPGICPGGGMGGFGIDRYIIRSRFIGFFLDSARRL